MNILQVAHLDLIGRRFNGYDLNAALRRDGVGAMQMVIEKDGNSEYVINLSQYMKNALSLRQQIEQKEYGLSVRGLLFPFGRVIEKHEVFLNANVVHYHMIYNGVLSLAHFARLTHKKPSLLSIHDCTLLTGHCVHPMECNRFESGCKSCPDLEKQFAIKEDKSALMWSVKKHVFEEVRLELVAGSKWMLDMIKRSPITSALKVHFIPFGIDVEFYAKRRENARNRLSIPNDDFVLFFRAQSLQKGLDHIQNAVELMNKKPFLLTCGQTDCFESYKGGVKELGLITDDDLMADLYAACDVFLMPSIGESFGFMAVECMASGKPIIVADGTSLPAVTFVPECGISIPQGDAEALKAAIERLRDNPNERIARGQMGQKLAREHYRFEDYYKRHKELYEETMRKGEVI